MTPPPRRFTAVLVACLVLSACGPDSRLFVVERNGEPDIEVRALSYGLNNSGQTLCAHFYDVRNVATICNVHLVRSK